ncbi:outer membrane fibronectin-binding protein [Hydrogenimonas sp.]|nr:outer membrane fibronectin-binding protein [Hydrogenimonas sp.]
MLIPVLSVAAQKRFTVGPMVNRLESIGKGLLDDGLSYGVRLGYNFDEHYALELSYDYLYNFVQETLPSKPATNGHQLMANFLYNVKDDEGFIPYMLIGLGAEKYDNSMGDLKSGGIAGIGLGAHLLIVEPVSLRMEFKDVVRFSDAGHTFSWRFGLEFSFGELERSVQEEVYSYYVPPRKDLWPELPPLDEKRPEGKYAEKSKKSYENYRQNRSEKVTYRAPAEDSGGVGAAVSPAVTAAAQIPESAEAALSSTSPKAAFKSLNTENRSGGNESGRIIAKESGETGYGSDELDIEQTAAGVESDGYGDGVYRNIFSDKETGNIAAESKAEKESVAKMKAAVETAKPAAAAERSERVERKRPTSEEAVCREDSDNDGVPDCRDICRDTPKRWVVDSDGCAKSVPMLVNFEFDSVKLDERDRVRIGQLAEYLRHHPDIRVRIEGHTDSIGSVRYNFLLSKRRALKVKSALTDLGVSPERIDIRAYGESRPAASNDTAAGRALNRRTDAIVIRLTK